MKHRPLSSFGFDLSWSFSNDEEDPSLSRIFADLNTVLSVCVQHELLIPLYYIDDGPDPHPLGTHSVAEAVRVLHEKATAGELCGEIARIGGEGWVYLEAGKRVRQTDLLTLDSIRLFERHITVQTRVNCWTPLAMDEDYVFRWQTEIADRNERRLECCLREISQTLQADVEPDPDQIDRDQPVWQKDFRLLWNPDLLKREYQRNPPPTEFDLARYLL